MATPAFPAQFAPSSGVPSSLRDARNRLFNNLGRLQALPQTAPEFRNLEGFFQQQVPRTLLDDLRATSKGLSRALPFSDSLIGALIGQQVGSLNRGRQLEEQSLRERFANAGLGGSGLETSSLVDARRAAASAARAARAQISSRAALQNFQARERARDKIAALIQLQLQNQQFLAQQRAALEAQSVLAQNEALSQFREIGPQASAQTQSRPQPRPVSPVLRQSPGIIADYIAAAPRRPPPLR